MCSNNVSNGGEEAENGRDEDDAPAVLATTGETTTLRDEARPSAPPKHQ